MGNKRNKLRLAFLLMFAMPIAPSLADNKSANPPPEFSSEEQSVIHRNAALDHLVQRNPRLVRQVLDAIARSNAEVLPDFSERTSLPRRKYERPPEPEQNPDLDQLGRSSPEAAHDLFQLIKKAAAGSRR